MTNPLVSVVLVNWNTPALTEAALLSFRTHERSTALEFIVVDNASTDDSVERFAAAFSEARIIRSPENEGFARGNNRGVEAAHGDYILLLNTDTIAHEEVLPACLAALNNSESAIVGCRLLNTDGSLQLSAEPFPRLRTLIRDVFRSVTAVQTDKVKLLPPPGRGAVPVDWICGAFMFMKRETYLRVGGLSSRIFMYGEDVEFCWRAARHGVRSLYLPDVSITHLGGGGTNHASLRGLLLSDAGRLRSFELMRGKGAALLMRIILSARSAIRVVVWGASGLLSGNSERRRKAVIHGRALLALAGLAGKAGRA
jgi:GT2 family glycosyltransferase